MKKKRKIEQNTEKENEIFYTEKKKGKLKMISKKIILLIKLTIVIIIIIQKNMKIKMKKKMKILIMMKIHLNQLINF